MTESKNFIDKERLKRMGLAGQQFVIGRYDWEKVCRNMVEIMKNHMEEHQ